MPLTESPMGCFAKKGDLRMMRWLYVNGADTRYKDVRVGFPMYDAALRARSDICKWLLAHGAVKDIKGRTRVKGQDRSDRRGLAGNDEQRWSLERIESLLRCQRVYHMSQSCHDASAVLPISPPQLGTCLARKVDHSPTAMPVELTEVSRGLSTCARIPERGCAETKLPTRRCSA